MLQTFEPLNPCELTPEQLASFRRDGYVVLPAWFSPAEVDMLRSEAANELVVDRPGRVLERSGAVRSVFASHRHSNVFSRLARLPRLAIPATQLLGERELYVHQFKVNAKVALDGDCWEWHQDSLFWLKEDGMPTSNVLSAVVFLNEVTDFNGPLLLIPGSHRLGVIDREVESKYAADSASEAWKSTLTADLKYKVDSDVLNAALRGSRIVAAKGKPGFVVFFHGNTLHASAGNLSTVDRLSVFVSYNPCSNALMPLANPRPTYIAERNFAPIRVLPRDSLLPDEGSLRVPPRL
ncbi:phytanoyl-CoA dioxygenase [Hyaloraphidium curvatum]|nr:phytanoyl-CoA dioxygenase [Hyaloraphidium curvatum]